MTKLDVYLFVVGFDVIGIQHFKVSERHSICHSVSFRKTPSFECWSTNKFADFHEMLDSFCKLILILLATASETGTSYSNYTAR